VKRLALVLGLVAMVAIVAVPSASALAFADEPCLETHPPSGILLVCPSGTLGASYSTQLAPKENAGNGPPYTFILKAGALPTGLQLSSSGLISGVPTGAGTAIFGIELQDNPGGCSGCGCVNRVPQTCAYRDFAITIAAGLRINNNSVKPGTIGQAYSETLTASLVTTLNPPAGPQVSAAWSVQSGTLPPGVALSPDGMLAGTPTAEGTYQFVVAAQSGDSSDIETLTIVVRQPVLISSPFTSATPPKSEVGVPFDATLTAAGGNGTFTWTLAGGSLPIGVALAADGTISGTPRVSGRFPFTASVTDGEARVTTLNATLAVAAKLAVKTLLLRPAKVGKLYRAKLATLGGVLPTKWKILRGTLPRGIRFDKTLGVFLGTPRRGGRYRVTVQVADALGVKSQKTLAIFVTAK
jgi:hypothetical protein